MQGVPGDAVPDPAVTAGSVPAPAPAHAPAPTPEQAQDAAWEDAAVREGSKQAAHAGTATDRDLAEQTKEGGHTGKPGGGGGAAAKGKGRAEKSKSDKAQPVIPLPTNALCFITSLCVQLTRDACLTAKCLLPFSVH